MRNYFLVFIALVLWIGGAVHAGTTGARVNVVSLRPYASSNSIYMQVSSTALCGTEVFTIPLTEQGGKEMYAAALTALVSNKQISLEVSNATGCTGWGTRLQSLNIYP